MRTRARQGGGAMWPTMWLVMGLGALLLPTACEGGGGSGVAGDVADTTNAPHIGDATFPERLTAQAVPAPPALLSGGLPAEAAVDETDRPRQALSGTWLFRFDDEEAGEAEGWSRPGTPRAEWVEIPVPGTWDLAVADGFDRQTVGWYARSFVAEDLGPRVRLVFEGMFREARVWLDGVELGGFDLPYLPFSFDVTGAVTPGAEHLLVVRVDNRLSWDTLPCDTALNTGNHGWMPYGGLTRRVYLQGSQATSVARAAIATEPTEAGATRVSVELLLRRAEAGSDPSAPSGGAPVELDVWVTATSGEVLHQATPGWLVAPDVVATRVSLDVPGLLPWSPEHPERRYRLHVRLRELPPGGAASTETVTETVAWDFGTARFVVADGRFRLEGRDRFLRGMNRHEDHPTLGPVFDEAVMAGDVALMGELHVDFARPGHYPNDVRVLRALEAAGVMMVEEVPVYQADGGQMEDPVFIDLATRALERMIARDRNRPGIVMWSVANEVMTLDPASEGFVRALVERSRALDPRRPTMMAVASAPGLSFTDLEVGPEAVDAVGINEYVGWYYLGAAGSLSEDLADYLETAVARFPDKAYFISEYGAGALLGRHSDPATVGEEPVGDHSYSEEFQAWFHETQLAVFAAREEIRGAMPWVLADFRMQWNPATGKPHPADLTNLKGLVSGERERKQAFAVVAARYAALAAEAAAAAEAAGAR